MMWQGVRGLCMRGEGCHPSSDTHSLRDPAQVTHLPRPRCAPLGNGGIIPRPTSWGC